MTDHHDEYGDILRRALHAEADTVVPAADGLERIRGRIAERKPRFGPAWLGWRWFGSSWFGPPRFVGGWVRPALAGAAALAVAGVVVSGPQAMDTITSAGRKNPAEQGSHGKSSTSGAVQPGESGEPSEERPPPRRTAAIHATTVPSVTASSDGRACAHNGTGESSAPNPSASPPAQDTSTCQPPPTTAPSAPVTATPPPPPPPAEPPPPSPVPQETQTTPTNDRVPESEPAPSP